jgi:hypothetical protein
MRTLDQLTDAYVALDSRDIRSREGLLDIRSALAELAQKVKEFRAEVEQALIENIDAHGDVNLGDKRLYVGVDRTYKCSDSRAVFVALLEATGGDESLMCEHLASSCFKPGMCRTTLGDRFGTLFSEEVAKDVKTGSSRRTVKTHDPAFAGKRGGE